MTYLNVDEVDQAVRNLAVAYPGLSTLIALPAQTAQGRASHALRLGTGAEGTKDAALLLGGVHAREWGSCEILVNLAADLLYSYTHNSPLVYGGQTYTGPQVRALLDRLHVVIFPLANPDGRKFSQETDPDWRKNRHLYCGHAHDGGVDINRNFDFLFDYHTAFDPLSQVSVSNNPCDFEVYQGPAAFSEAETQNVRSLLDSHTRTRWFVDVHSYGEKIMYSWGDDRNQTTTPGMNFQSHAHDGQRGRGVHGQYGEYLPGADLAAAQALAQAYCAGVLPVRNNAYAAQPSFDLYPTAGASDDYAFSRYFVNNARSKVISFTVEFGEEFVEPWNDMLDIIRDVSSGLIGLCLAAPVVPPVAVVPNNGGQPPGGNAPAPDSGGPKGGPAQDPANIVVGTKKK